MEITEVRVKLTENHNDKLQAFCSITLKNDFVVRDVKMIEGAQGGSASRKGVEGRADPGRETGLA